MKKSLIIILAILVIIGIAAGIFYYLKKKKEAETDPDGTSVNVSIHTQKSPQAKGPAISAGFQKWMKDAKASGALEGDSKSTSNRYALA